MREQVTGFIDPEELARLANLSLIARAGVMGFHGGLHRSLHTGASAEFAQYRTYAQGDDPRFVDWRIYARTDRLHIKEFQDETNLRCTILLDCSASMDYGSGRITKFRYAQMLAACLSLMLSRQHDAIGMIAYDDKIGLHMPPRANANHARRMLVELENLRPAGATDTDRALRYIGDILMPRGMVVLISDLLHPLDQTLVHLRSLRARRHDVLVFQIADPTEQTFAFDRGVTLRDPEDGREQFVVPQALRDEYLANRERHFSRIRRECLAAEISIEELVTNQPLDRALNFYLQRRRHALVTASRRSGRAAGGAN
jgi:uncharacterized protein (DUF58 family)